ncbi:MAG: A/G-specific adenine glycosylase [Kiritimatiellia bacterium]|jgi:A/G-specific adenine glycosylase
MQRSLQELKHLDLAKRTAGKQAEHRNANKTRRPEAPPFAHEKLLAWYRANHREMPWRGHPSPYAVWVSEIMLQQTQVETVRPYFDRFMAKFPTVRDLANAELEAALSLWQGLGYYARARNLHRAAKMIAAQQDAALPRKAAELAMLPGVGDYTAAAIASICFGERTPVVDGNVARVFARHDRLDDDFRAQPPRRALAKRLQPAFDATESPGDLNQAMMELGALVCRPRRPDCEACPLSTDCIARQRGEQADYPKRPSKPPLPVRRAVAVLLRCRRRWLLVQRGRDGLLGGLWELPGGPIEGDESPEAAARRLVPERTGIRLGAIEETGLIRHGFSHFTLELHVLAAERAPERSRLSSNASARWVADADLAALPVATAHRRALGLVK